MKKKPILIIATLSVLAFVIGYWVGSRDPMAPNVGDGTLREGLWAYYPFAADTRDHSGHGRHATNEKAELAEDRFGKANQAYQFNGSWQWMEIPWQSSGFTGSYTLSAWVYVDSGPGENKWQNIMSDPESTFQLLINNERVLEVYPLRITGAQLPIGKWTHVVLVNEGGRHTIFQEGQITMREDVPVDESLSHSPVQVSRIATWKKPDEVANELFEGRLDDIRIYSRALSDKEVQELYDLEKGG